jgi:SAM-dependent methyltransferase
MNYRFIFLAVLFFSCGFQSLFAQVCCSLCNSRLEKFSEGGTILKRENARCPHCWSFERHRHLCLFLKSHCPELFSKHLVLFQWAPEPPLIAYFSGNPLISYRTLSIPLWSWQQHRSMKNADVLKLDYDDSSVDAIICCHVLSHVFDDKSSIKEMIRILKPGGWAIFMAPLYNNLQSTYEDSSIMNPEDRVLYFGCPDHVRKYGTDFPDILRFLGLSVSVHRLTDLAGDMRALYGLDGYDDDIERNAARGADIFFCTKR